MAAGSVRARGGSAAAAVLLAHAATTLVLLWGTGGAVDAVRAPGPASVGSAVALAAAGCAWAVLTWLSAVTVLALLTAAVAGLGSRAHARATALAPAAARRLVAALLGMTVAGAPLAVGLPARAAEQPTVAASTSGPSARDHRTDPAPARLPAQPERPSLDRPAAEVPTGWTPDRPAVPLRRAATSEAAVRLVATTPHPELAVTDEVVVRGGDTLWDIAARHLGPDASAADIAHEWPRWHAANRAVIGDDPDLLRPGERLLPPG